ncbi:hypothetical protein E3N88_41311 [Mikania micrantha]|uniref:Uncharacterized protein n=1 Tax=Mikania micrantha TaxID=192012 RepID=A0A5N6LQ73_9ASTR|nr:hypothetical protein E3N88_41311 [Mikania micrantha]
MILECEGKSISPFVPDEDEPPSPFDIDDPRRDNQILALRNKSIHGSLKADMVEHIERTRTEVLELQTVCFLEDISLKKSARPLLDLFLNQTLLTFELFPSSSPFFIASLPNASSTAALPCRPLPPPLHPQPAQSPPHLHSRRHQRSSTASTTTAAPTQLTTPTAVAIHSLALTAALSTAGATTTLLHSRIRVG